MNRLRREGSISEEDSVLALFMRLAGSWWLGVGLASVAIIFVVSRWRSFEFEDLQSVSLLLQIAAASVYVVGLVALAQMPRESGDRTTRLLCAGLSAQLLKYVPGSVWQGQPLLAVGGGSAIARLVAGVLMSAGVGLAISDRLLAVVLGVIVLGVAMGASWRLWGWVTSKRLLLLSIPVAMSVFISGVLVGTGAGLDPWWSGREMAGAWGLGVVAVPVPAGLGIREFFLSLSSQPQAAAQLGVVHRVVTLAADVVVGAIGMICAAKNR